MTAWRPVVRGLLWGLVGFLAAAGLLAVLRLAWGRPPVALEPLISFGYPFGLAGWLLGVGVWDRWARGWLGLPLSGQPPRDWRRYLAFSTDHKVIQYLVTVLALFFLGGLLAILMRLELVSPQLDLLTARGFYTTMSLHGIIMVAVAVAGLIGGLGNYAVPILIGAEDMAFPRLNALSYWLVPPVGVLLLATPLAGGFDTGWTAYPPLSLVNASGQLLYLLAFITFGLSSVLGGLNFLVTIARLRAPGMSWGRLPIFVWSIFAASILSLLFTQFVAAGLLMLTLDRVAGTGFFSAARGGDPLLYQHIFWMYSHPAVYIMILPAFGVVLEVLTHFGRKPLFAYRWAVASFFGIVGLSGLVWAHHMFTSGMPEFLMAPFLVATELISIPTGVVFLSALGTLWMGRLWLKAPMLFALGFVFNFLIGGITGIYLADVPTDIHLQDTYFVVAHFHYTIVGGTVFGLLAGIYYWFPKITGRMVSERLAQVHFWGCLVAFNAMLLPMFNLGLQGLNRRVASYPAEYATMNVLISAAGFVLGTSFLVFLINMVRSWVGGPRAEANPWRARTLEWLLPSPVPEHTFASPPRVVGYPYDYGTPGSVHAVLGAGGGAE